jgi:hypothetical protein
MANLMADNFITELGLDKLPPEKQQELFAKIGEVIFQGVLIRVLDEMKPAEQKKLKAFLEVTGEDGEKIIKYLEENVPDFNQLVEAEVEKFKKESYNLINSITK